MGNQQLLDTAAEGRGRAANDRARSKPIVSEVFEESETVDAEVNGKAVVPLSRSLAATGAEPARSESQISRVLTRLLDIGVSSIVLVANAPLLLVITKVHDPVLTQELRVELVALVLQLEEQLLDIELDASMSYWRLAFRTRGSFMSPSEDWP